MRIGVKNWIPRGKWPAMGAAILLSISGGDAVATDLIGGALPEMLSPEEALEAFTVAEDYQVNLFASEKDFPIQSPAAMTFDSRGRLWVSCVTSHPHALPGVEPRDSILILEDEDRDGSADKCTVFYDKLYLPMGFALADGGRTVFVVSEPNLLRLTDTDGDGVADEERIELHGLGTEDNHHVASGFQWGPDGRLYFGQGLFLNTQIETPHGPVRAFEATVFRFDPRTHKLEVHGSFGWSNPWGIVFDHWGQPLLADASPALNYYLPYMTSNFHYPKPGKYESFTTVRNQYSFTPAGRRPSCGNELLLSEHFPEEVRGWYVTNQMKGWHGIRWYQLHEEGAGYGTTQPRGEEELLTTTDITFRPTGLQLGPDGALYVLDYYNPIVGHTTYNFRDARRIQTHGRVWRITHKSRPLVWQPEIRGASVDVLLELLKDPNYRTRYFARRELQERDAGAVVPEIEKWVHGLETSDPASWHHQVEALWLYQGQNHYDFALLERLLGGEDYHVRTAAGRVLRFWQGSMAPDRALKLLERAITDEHQAVRLEALLACGYHVEPESAIEVAALALDRDMDTGFQLAAQETLGYLAGVTGRAPSEVEVFLLPTLEDAQLLAKELTEPVAYEILRRVGLDTGSYIEALAHLSGGEDSASFALMASLVEEDTEGRYLASMSKLLIKWPRPDEIRTVAEETAERWTRSKNRNLSRYGYGLMIKVQGSGLRAAELAAAKGPLAVVDLLLAVSLLGREDTPGDLFPFIAERLEKAPKAIRVAAAEAITGIAGREEAAVELLGGVVDAEGGSGDLALSFAALKSMQRVPRQMWPLEHREKQVTLVRITATPDLKFSPASFAVPAGSAVELEFVNPDNLYHNLVIVMPGAEEEVGLAADAMAATPEGLERNYVPDTEKVLHWTPQLALRKRHRLQFFAPEEPGDYPYLCTFPGHWRVMRGVMRVGVEKAD